MQPPLYYINFRQHIPQFFSTTFFATALCFLKLIKCVELCNFMLKICTLFRMFDKFLQHHTQFDTIRPVYNIHCRIATQFEASCRFMKLNVEACKSYFFPFIIIIPLYMKIIQRINRKFRQNPTLLV